MNKKFLIISAGAAIFLIVIVTVVVLANKKSGPAPGISIVTQQGTVQVNNYTQSAKYNFTTATVLESNPTYGITAFPNGVFSIIINSPPIQASRDQAEQAFLKDLGISQSDACKLTVSLSVTEAADPQLPSKNYGLSFCPDGIPFN